MTWLKTSDTANDFDAVTAPLAWDPDPAWPTLDAATDMAILSLALRGLVDACAVRGARAGDYLVPNGTIAAQARTPHWRLLADLAERAGYWTRHESGEGYELVRESEDFVHIRPKAEVEWERARKRDCANKKLTAEVRRRDGDGCRDCGTVVDWDARTGTRAGTYGHRIPGQAARGPEDLYVTHNGCNASLGANEAVLMPVPRDPFYGPNTVEFLARRGIVVEPSNKRTRRQRTTASTTARPAPAATASDDPAASRTTPSTTAAPAPAAAASDDPAAGRTTPRTASTTARPAPAEHRDRPARTTPQPAEHRARPGQHTNNARSNGAERRQRTPHGTAGNQPSDPGRPGSGRDGTGSPDLSTGDPSARNQATSRPKAKPRGKRPRRGKPPKGATP